jgi:hypothetical protein
MPARWSQRSRGSPDDLSDTAYKARGAAAQEYAKGRAARQQLERDPPQLPVRDQCVCAISQPRGEASACRYTSVQFQRSPRPSPPGRDVVEGEDCRPAHPLHPRVPQLVPGHADLAAAPLVVPLERSQAVDAARHVRIGVDDVRRPASARNSPAGDGMACLTVRRLRGSLGTRPAW